MSIARLAALVLRAAAPPGRVAREAAIPAFDAPAAVDTAARQADLATMPGRAEARRAAPAAPRLVTSPAEEVPSALALTARRAAPERGPQPEPAATAAAAHAMPAPAPAMLPTIAAPVADVRTPSPPPIVATPAGEAETPARVVAAPVLSEALPRQPPRVHLTPPRRAQADDPVSEAPQAVPAPAITIAEPALAAPRSPPAASALAAAAPAPEPAAPAITIGTVEVVIAQPPARPAPKAAPRPTPDRGFSRYAAIRSGRDRAW